MPIHRTVAQGIVLMSGIVDCRKVVRRRMPQTVVEPSGIVDVVESTADAGLGGRDAGAMGRHTPLCLAVWNNRSRFALSYWFPMVAMFTGSATASRQSA